MTKPSKESTLSRIGPESATLLHFDRQMALGFGALVLVMMVVVCLAGVFTYRSVSVGYEKQLTTALAGVLADSINRTSFSGRYHTRLLLEETTAKQPQLAYVLVAGSDNIIIAHSSPELNDTALPRRLATLADYVHGGTPTFLNRNTTKDGVIQEILVPYQTGYEDQTAGVIIIGISLDSFSAQISAVRFFLALLIILLTIIALVATYFMSKRLASPVRQLASMLQGILDHAPIFVGICRRDGTLVQSSSSSLAMLSENIEANRWPLLTAHDNTSFDLNHIYSDESWFQLDGKDRVAAVTTFPIENDSGGKTNLLCSIGMDITDLRNAEESLRQHRDELERLVYRRTRELEDAYETIRKRESELISMSQLRESLLDNIPFEEKYQRITEATARLTTLDFVCIWAIPSRLDSIINTPDMLDLTHQNAEPAPTSKELELLALHPKTDGPDLATIQELRDGVWAVGQVYGSLENHVLRNELNPEDDGSWALLQGFTSFAGYRLSNSDGIFAGVLAVYGRAPITLQQMAILEDLSTTTAYVIQAQQAAIELEHASRNLIRQERLATLGKLTATVSHELRNPLGTVGASFFTITQQLRATDDPKLQRALERGTRSIERCDRIIEELLRFTRDITLRTEPIRFDEWLAEELSTYAFPTEVQIDVENSEAIELIMDPQAVYQCLVNLLNNACDAVAERPAGKQRIQISLQQVDDEVHLVVEDSGPGIDPKDQRQAFEPLYSTKGFGTGLGLPLVQKLIGLHGGRLTLDTSTLGGVRATLSLPGRGATQTKRRS